MGKRIFLWQAAGFAFVSLAGSLLHFLYDWTGECILIAPFSGVNESTWEHMKLLYWPFSLFAVIQRRWFRAYPQFWCIQLESAIAGLLAIPLLFYTCNGIFGKTPDWVNITLFYLSTGTAFYLAGWRFRQGAKSCRHPHLALALLLLLGLLFGIFTFLPPRIPLFQDPITGGFGKFYDA